VAGEISVKQRGKGKYADEADEYEPNDCTDESDALATPRGYAIIPGSALIGGLFKVVAELFVAAHLLILSLTHQPQKTADASWLLVPALSKCTTAEVHVDY
jgi:hypothetical protein